MQEIDKKLFTGDPMIPEALRESNIFDHTPEELIFLMTKIDK